MKKLRGNSPRMRNDERRRFKNELLSISKLFARAALTSDRHDAPLFRADSPATACTEEYADLILKIGRNANEIFITVEVQAGDGICGRGGAGATGPWS